MRLMHSCLLMLAIALSGCSTVPKSLATADGVDDQIRIGGRLVRMVVEPDQTCLLISGKPLDVNARPRVGKPSTGRFWACRPGFLEPTDIDRRAEVTVLAAPTSLTRPASAARGEPPAPIYDVQVIYVWPERQNDLVYLSPGLFGTFWGYYEPTFVRYRARHDRPLVITRDD